MVGVERERDFTWEAKSKWEAEKQEEWLEANSSYKHILNTNHVPHSRQNG